MKVTAEVEAEIVERIERGEHAKMIRREVGCSHHVVKRVAAERGLTVIKVRGVNNKRPCDVCGELTDAVYGVCGRTVECDTERCRRRYVAHPEQAADIAHRRRARKMDNPGYGVDPHFLGALTFVQGNLCAYCGTAPIEHLDHVVSLKVGGGHCWCNVLWSCKACNLSKSSKDVAAWFNARFGVPWQRPVFLAFETHAEHVEIVRVKECDVCGEQISWRNKYGVCSRGPCRPEYLRRRKEALTLPHGEACEAA